jgi:hypothetical protein
VIGGKDPGTYMNEGIQIAQRGALVIHEPVLAAVPTYARDLFFPSHAAVEYYGIRFMGFYVRDPRTGSVTGQFPQLFPLSIAIGYGLDGLTGARMTIGVWAILGLLAFYFAGARWIGAPAAAAAAALLALNVAEVWFSRYPNSEIVMQACLFGALLSFARAYQDGDGFFAPVAALLVGLMLFARIEALLLVVPGMVAAGVLGWLVDRRRFPWAFLVALAPWLAGALFYYEGPLLPYFARAISYFQHLPAWGVILGAVGIGAAAVVLLILRGRFDDRTRRLVPECWAAALVILAVYAAFFREPGGRLAEYDAHSLRTFTAIYLLWPGLAAALAGMVLLIRRHFWSDPAFVVVFSGLSIFFLYKIQVVPSEFWAARRFLPVILPGALLFAAGAGLARTATRQWIRIAAGAAVVGVLGYQYTVRAEPVMPHVEYAGVIPALEHLASQFGDRDLVLVESRDAGSDMHVLAVPLAYIYARNVLVLNSARPDKFQLREFLGDALKQYAHVYFVGSGGTDLLSRHIGARPVTDARVKVPEFESTAATLPASVHRKDFDYTVYELQLDPPPAESFSLDVGNQDDLHVLRFYAKETTEGRTIRWTGPRSVVAIPNMTGREREIVLVMSDGGRPQSAAPAHVDVLLDGTPLGGADVGPGFHEYRFAIPPDAAARASSTDTPAQLTLVSSAWKPQQLLGGTDDRTLGVMLDRIDVR